MGMLEGEQLPVAEPLDGPRTRQFSPTFGIYSVL